MDEEKRDYAIFAFRLRQNTIKREQWDSILFRFGSTPSGEFTSRVCGTLHYTIQYDTQENAINTPNQK